MGFYVNVKAKEGCASQINELWAQASQADELIWTAEKVKKQIKHIHKASEVVHLRHIKTVDDWNSAFPAAAVGTGQIFIGSVGFDKGENPQETATLIEQVQFVLDHRLLFQSVTGLADARNQLDIQVEGDFLDEHGKPGSYPVDSFEKLPARSTSKIYRNCLQYNRPDFWAAYLAFESAPNDATWCELRCKTVPWSTRIQPTPSIMGTVWQACEKTATARDGQSFGLMGRYRDGVVPSMFELLRAIKPA